MFHVRWICSQTLSHVLGERHGSENKKSSIERLSLTLALSLRRFFRYCFVEMLWGRHEQELPYLTKHTRCCCRPWTGSELNLTSLFPRCLSWHLSWSVPPSFLPSLLPSLPPCSSLCVSLELRVSYKDKTLPADRLTLDWRLERFAG